MMSFFWQVYRYLDIYITNNRALLKLEIIVVGGCNHKGSGGRAPAADEFQILKK